MIKKTHDQVTEEYFDKLDTVNGYGMAVCPVCGKEGRKIPNGTIKHSKKVKTKSARYSGPITETTYCKITRTKLNDRT